MHAPVVASHIQTVPSDEPARTTFPLTCQSSHSMSPGPSKDCCKAPEAASQIRTIPSMPPVASKASSKEKATAITESVCPSRRATRRVSRDGSATSQRPPRSSPPPVATRKIPVGGGCGVPGATVFSAGMKRECATVYIESSCIPARVAIDISGTGVCGSSSAVVSPSMSVSRPVPSPSSMSSSSSSSGGGFVVSTSTSSKNSMDSSSIGSGVNSLMLGNE
mmetsp:Transcript_8000/g.10013  ORF Transcript_8000/g.10013 Transcript_8000/m.10013 type:complete len:221 (-) Transcript_8000:10-672(-)